MFDTKRKLLANKINKRAGFTVIEILLVVVMIAIATSIAAPNFAGFTGDADAEIIKADLAAVHTIASNLAKEKEINIDKYFIKNSDENKELLGEIKAVTNFNDDKIAEYEFGMNNGKFAVHVEDRNSKDYVWDGQNLLTDETVTKITAQAIESNKLFEKTGGYIPDPEEHYFSYKDGDPSIITGLTELGRSYFERDLIIPTLSEEDPSKAIKGIQANAFKNENLNSAYIPPSVISIGTNSFANNGASGKSNSIENDVARVSGLKNEVDGKYFNGHVGKWVVKGNLWSKRVFYKNITPAGRMNNISIGGLSYRSSGVDQFHKATVVTRVPIAGQDSYTQLRPAGSNAASKAARPGRIVPSVIKDDGQTGTASGTINDGKLIDPVGEETVIQGRPRDTRQIKNWGSSGKSTTYRIDPSDMNNNTNWTKLTWEKTVPSQLVNKAYSGKHVGDGKITEVSGSDTIKNDFVWTGTLKQDKVINGGTAQHERWVTGIPAKKTFLPGKQDPTMHHSEGTYPNIYSTQTNNDHLPYKINTPLVFDKVINGGTAAHAYAVDKIKNPHETRPGHQPATFTHYVNKGHLNEYSGLVTRYEVNNNGTPAGSYVVNNIKGPNGISDKIGPSSVPNTYVYSEGSGVRQYTGTLNKFVYSGTPYDKKHVSGQFRTSAGQSAPATKAYNSAGYVGTLSRRHVSGTPADSKYVTNQASSKYSSAGYVGTLDSYGHETWNPATTISGSASREANGYEDWAKVNNPSFATKYKSVTMRRHERQRQVIAPMGTAGWDGYRTSAELQTHYTYTSQYFLFPDGYGGTLTKYSANEHLRAVPGRDAQLVASNRGRWFDYDTRTETFHFSGEAVKPNFSIVRTNIVYPSFPSTVSVTSGNYSGSIGKSGGTVLLWDEGSSTPSSAGRTYFRQRQNYSGTLTRPGYNTYPTRYRGTVNRPDTRIHDYYGDVVRPDTRTWRYNGTISKTDTRLWDYKGTVSKEDTRLWNYKGTLGKGDTREWDYSGEVTTDTREWRYYYYYRTIIE